VVVNDLSVDRLLARLLKDGDEAYRDAIASSVEGVDPTEAWRRWEDDTAALLLISWASGALTTVRAAGVPERAVGEAPISRFQKTPDSVSVRFRSGIAREVIERYIRLLPMTRQRWEELISYAFSAASEMRSDEAANALERIMERSPDLAALIRGTPFPTPEDAPEIVRGRRAPPGVAAVQGSFFVTGLSPKQILQTKNLLAKTIRGEVTQSVAGKRLQELGVGDFVEQTVLKTGTDLTAARLETVYRTNINRAQSQGRLDIVREPTVQRFVPLMRFRSTKDRRTRPTHRAMDGYVATVAMIDGMGIPTPLGFNCRCTWTPIPIAVAVREGLCDEDGNPDFDAIRTVNGSRQALIDRGEVPDRGFISG
jgi:SPP1 gp7 family putative phage head morphogenesis protein